MKKTPMIIVLLLVVFTTLAAYNLRTTSPQKQATKSFGEFKFKELSHNFGKINDGDTVSHKFDFINVGKVPLVINDISTSCGCTAVEWSDKPIPPGGNGAIVIQFSKKHDPGVHIKNAIIKANTEDPYSVLRISAEIQD